MRDGNDKPYQVTFVWTRVASCTYMYMQLVASRLIVVGEMAAILRKNKAWLIDLMKPNLLKVVPSLCSENIITVESKKAALQAEEDDDASRRLFSDVENEIERQDEPCSFGIKFLEVLKNSNIGRIKDLQVTIEEFREEQRRASRRSSTSTASSTPGSLDSSSSSVFAEPSYDGENTKRRGSTGSLDRSGRRRKSSERRASTGSDSSLTLNLNTESGPFYSQGSKAVVNEQTYDGSDRGEIETLHCIPRLPSITENPDSPEVSKKFGTVAPNSKLSPQILQSESESLSFDTPSQHTAQHTTSLATPFQDTASLTTPHQDLPKLISPLPVWQLPSSTQPEWPLPSGGQLVCQATPTPLQQTASVATPLQQTANSATPLESPAVTLLSHPEVEVDKTVQCDDNEDQFYHDLQTFVSMVEAVPCQEDAYKIKDIIGEQLTMKIDQKETQCKKLIDAHEIEKSKEDKLNKSKLEERAIQVAELEKKVYSLEKKRKLTESDCQKLREELARKENEIGLLKQTIHENCQEIEELRGGNSVQVMSCRKKRDQWREMKQLVDQLFERREMLAQTKQAILEKYESIKLGRKRPSTSYM